MTEQLQTGSEAPPGEEPGQSKQKRVVVRHGRIGHVGVFRHHLDGPLRVGSMVVARTERGTELGRVLVNVGDGPQPDFIHPRSLEDYLAANGDDYPFTRSGRILRPANPQDINDQHHLDISTHEETGYCNEQIKQSGLEMRLVSVEHILGGERIVFYFSAEHRVDFRELVRKLAGEYHTRIEMRQVGARDEARLIADYERCGLRCCCQQYLKLLKPVSMRMAKTQKATLDPTKISGRCGRLMCCLRYEDSTYEELLALLPKKNTWVRTADGAVGKVVDVQILTQLVRLVLADRTQVAVANEEIVERNVPQPPPAAVPEKPRPPPVPARPRPTGRPARKVSTANLDEVLAGMEVHDAPARPEPEPEPEPSGPPATRPADQSKPRPSEGTGAGKKRPRHRRKSRKKVHPGALSAPPQVQAGQPRREAKTGGTGPASQAGGTGQASSRGGKRRRRKKKRGGGQSPPPSPS